MSEILKQVQDDKAGEFSMTGLGVQDDTLRVWWLTGDGIIRYVERMMDQQYLYSITCYYVNVP
ncbi:MAG: hypothetical protein KBD24_02360 [Candidatus Pacebacteria bacterium]|nr:hypothetical protein [Candidatus Paceibacterota bacterium]